ncbi:MAG: hypothetical protein ACKO65_09535, partial [Betaproteobacteria bacterium]
SATLGKASLKADEFKTATETIKNQILDWVKDNKPCKRVVLSAIGAGEFLNMLSNESKENTRDIIAFALAEVTQQLASERIEIGFSDVNDTFVSEYKVSYHQVYQLNFLDHYREIPTR